MLYKNLIEGTLYSDATPKRYITYHKKIGDRLYVSYAIPESEISNTEIINLAITAFNDCLRHNGETVEISKLEWEMALEKVPETGFDK